MRDDILYYSKELKKFPDDYDDRHACLMDMGIKALRFVHTIRGLFSTPFLFFSGLSASLLDQIGLFGMPFFLD